MTDSNDALAPRPIGGAEQQAAAVASDDGVPKKDETSGVTVLEVVERGGKVTIVLECHGKGSVEKLMGYNARNLAYAQRLQLGMANSGIDAGSGTYIPEDEMVAAKEEDRPVNIWRNDYTLTPSI